MSGVDCDLEFGADAVGRSDQHRIAIPGGFQVKQSAEAAQIGVGASAPRLFRQRCDALDKRVAGLDIDAGIFVGETISAAFPVLGHLLAVATKPEFNIRLSGHRQTRKLAGRGGAVARASENSRFLRRTTAGETWIRTEPSEALYARRRGPTSNPERLMMGEAGRRRGTCA